jgi:hypothetical protein
MAAGKRQLCRRSRLIPRPGCGGFGGKSLCSASVVRNLYPYVSPESGEQFVSPWGRQRYPHPISWCLAERTKTTSGSRAGLRQSLARPLPTRSSAGALRNRRRPDSRPQSEPSAIQRCAGRWPIQAHCKPTAFGTDLATAIKAFDKPWQILRRNTRPVIGDSEQDVVAVSVVSIPRLHGGPDHG